MPKNPLIKERQLNRWCQGKLWLIRNL